MHTDNSMMIEAESKVYIDLIFLENHSAFKNVDFRCAKQRIENFFAHCIFCKWWREKKPKRKKWKVFHSRKNLFSITKRLTDNIIFVFFSSFLRHWKFVHSRYPNSHDSLKRWYQTNRRQQTISQKTLDYFDRTAVCTHTHTNRDSKIEKFYKRF